MSEKRRAQKEKRKKGKRERERERPESARERARTYNNNLVPAELIDKGTERAFYMKEKRRSKDGPSFV